MWEVLSPFRYLDIAHVYSQYSGIIDFFLFLILFVGIARVTLEKRFEGRGGKAVIVGIGLTLALGLSITESRFGFNISSLGGIALWFFVLAFGLVLFFFLNSAGLQKTTAFSLAFIVSYVLTLSLSPKLGVWIRKSFPLLDLVFLLAVGFLLFKGVAFFASDKTVKNSVGFLASKSSEIIHNIPLERVFDREFKNTSFVQDVRSSSKILKKLVELREFIKEFGATEQGRNAVIAEIKSLAGSENKLLQKIGYLKELNKRLEELDVKIVRSIKEERGVVPEYVMLKVDMELEELKKKFRLGEKLADFEKRLENCVEGLSFALFSCIENLQVNKVSKALGFIDKAIEQQVLCESLLSDMDTVSEFMNGLIKREFNIRKKVSEKAA